MFSAIGPVMDGQAFKMRNFSVGESTAVQMLLSHIAPQFATSSKKKKIPTLLRLLKLVYCF